MAVVLATECGSNTEEGIRSSVDNDPIYASDAVGPFAVGRSTFTIVDAARDGRELPVDGWYPVDAEDATGAPSLYQVSVQILFIKVVFTSPSELALDAPPVSKAGALTRQENLIKWRFLLIKSWAAGISSSQRRMEYLPQEAEVLYPSKDGKEKKT